MTITPWRATAVNPSASDRWEVTVVSAVSSQSPAQAGQWKWKSCTMTYKKRSRAGCYSYRCSDGRLHIMVRNVSYQNRRLFISHGLHDVYVMLFTSLTKMLHSARYQENIVFTYYPTNRAHCKGVFQTWCWYCPGIFVAECNYLLSISFKWNFFIAYVCNVWKVKLFYQVYDG